MRRHSPEESDKCLVSHFMSCQTTTSTIGSCVMTVAVNSVTSLPGKPRSRSPKPLRENTPAMWSFTYRTDGQTGKQWLAAGSLACWSDEYLRCSDADQANCRV